MPYNFRKKRICFHYSSSPTGLAGCYRWGPACFRHEIR